jgi:tRNA U34 5-methylaminomethyl-2-thiouridine-forming methyltransferase MnmC
MDEILFEINKTSDGSHTLRNNLFNSEYHSMHGAVQESMHVFIKNGLEQLLNLRNFSNKRTALNILEIGLGTHLNALLTIDFILTNSPDTQIYYEAIEKYPVPDTILEGLNYMRFVSEKSSLLFPKMIAQIANQKNMITELFEFQKTIIDLQDYIAYSTFDLVYMDAFDPLVQPEMWSVDTFGKLYQCMNKESILVTYSASGQVRRNMQSVGFDVQRLPGPPGKREMLKATRS